MLTEVELHIYINKAGKMLINPERINLLRWIHKTGSLLKASREIGVSYNKAWKILEAINTVSNKPVVKKIRGGKGGGGAQITDYGMLVLTEFEAMERVIEGFTKKLNTEINI
jgi:molybdate transport system regulatory protein